MDYVKQSIVCLVLLLVVNTLNGQLISDYYGGDSLISININSTAAAVSTIELDTTCETFSISIPDPINAPLPSFNPYIFRTNDTAGNPVLDITNNVNVTMRVRSLEEVTIDVLFRSGGGSSSERSDRKAFTVPAGLDQWTEFTLTWAASDLGGFVTTDLRDLWFYLDRGVENFAGNEIYFDHIIVGGEADTTRNSPCALTTPTLALISDYYEGTSLTSISTGGAAASVSTIELDTLCETIRISVTDTMNAPLPSFNAYTFRTNDAAGNPVLDITDHVNVRMRVRSLEEVTIDVLFRSGGGSSSERSDRKAFTVPAGLDQWTEFTLTWEASDLGGFVTTDLRDMWFYLDRGVENFAGNEIYFDHIVVGGEAEETRNSPCMLGGPTAALISDYYEGDSLTSININSAAASVSTIELDTTCEAFSLSVTDPVNAPLASFNAYIFRTNDAAGNPVLDLTDHVNVTMRVRSLEEVTIDVLFRSGGGSSSERSDRKAFTVPAGLDQWTEFTLTWEASDLGGFVTTDLRDMWFYLDRGTENFAGNEIYIDHIVVGGEAEETRNSPCTTFTQPTSFEEYFTGDSLMSINTGSTAGAVTNFNLDTLCEVLLLSVADPNAAPLPSFNAYQVVATDATGAAITNIEGLVNTTFRVSSPEEISIDILFRSGGGTTGERSERKSVVVPGGLDQWTEFTLSWSGTELDGFDPTDLRDMWFYLDRGAENFAGNELYIDHIVIGTTPDSGQNSDCVFELAPQAWIENWNTDNPTAFIGSDVDRLNITVDETCEEVKIEVIDPVGNPLQAFRPLALDPLDRNGLNIGFINDNPFVNIRARSAEDVELGVLLRSRDGTTAFRTDILTQTIIGDLTGYSNLTFEFDAASLGGFDVEDFLDIWIYLDRAVDNFAGNEVYFDFVSLDLSPDTSQYSPCGLPDLMSNATEDLFLGEIKAYPNPASDILTVAIPQPNNLGKISFVVSNMLGQVVLTRQVPDQGSFEIQLEGMETGIYNLNIFSEESMIDSIKFIKLNN